MSLILVAMPFGHLLWEYILLHLFISIVLHGSSVHGKFTASKVCLHVCWDKNCTQRAVIMCHWLWQSRDIHWFVCSNWCYPCNMVQSHGNVVVNTAERQCHQSPSSTAPMRGFVDSVCRYNIHLCTLYIICVENNSLWGIEIFAFFFFFRMF